METLERVLAAHPFFEGLERRYLPLMVGCAANVRFAPGEFIFREGAEANQLYLLRHGKVALEVSMPDRAAITIQTLGEGDVLGWSWLIPPHRWRFDARAVEPTLAFALDGKCLRGKCEEDHDLGYALMKQFASIIAQRLQATRLQLLEIYGAYCTLAEGRV
ncbi:MAG TPA: cyclic nucleotide-binding domain-containing protein [Chthonomonadaceae bacterium]|nr:cyclic nucleotide-binding domain-containing protein [Chthonomonadaceae bacterium]